MSFCRCCLSAAVSSSYLFTLPSIARCCPIHTRFAASKPHAPSAFEALSVLFVVSCSGRFSYAYILLIIVEHHSFPPAKLLWQACRSLPQAFAGHYRLPFSFLRLQLQRKAASIPTDRFHQIHLAAHLDTHHVATPIRFVWIMDCVMEEGLLAEGAARTRHGVAMLARGFAKQVNKD